jgi:sec-independent protein translocase protein TatB
MFDVGFWELCLIAIVALVVLGPERLPRAARTAGFLIGKARRAVTDLRTEIERELDLDDLRRMKQQQEKTLREAVDDTRSALKLERNSAPSVTSAEPQVEKTASEDDHHAAN